MPQKNNAALVVNLSPYFVGRGERGNVYTINVSNPPTDAELDAAFGTPADVGEGWYCWIDDNNLGLTIWHVASVNTQWVYRQYSVAI